MKLSRPQLSNLLLIVFAISFISCSVGPDYVVPEIQTDSQFSTHFEGLSANSPEVKWWLIFNDLQLTDLIEHALANNKDLKIAQARLSESRELLNEGRYNYYPTVTSSTSYENSQLSTQQARGLSQADRRVDLFRIGFDAFWELDLFGRVRRDVEQREALYQANQAALNNVMISLIAEVGRNYFQLRGDQARLLVAKQNAANQQQTLNLTKAQLEGGQATELETSRASAQLNFTLSIVPPLESAVKANIFRLSVLLGEQPTFLEPELAQIKDLPKLPEYINVGDPKSLLIRRPDVQVAERNLAAAVAQVGVSTAELFPKITFNGNIGYVAGSPRDFFKNAYESWTLGPGISWAAFDLGRVRALLRASEASSEASLSEFELTVLQALEETERAFVRLNSTRQAAYFLSEASKASKKAAELANFRYRDGVTDFTTVLDAERSMLETEDRLVVSKTEEAIAIIAVYKALGGGWETFPNQSRATN